MFKILLRNFSQKNNNFIGVSNYKAYRNILLTEKYCLNREFTNNTSFIENNTSCDTLSNTLCKKQKNYEQFENYQNYLNRINNNMK